MKWFIAVTLIITFISACRSSKKAATTIGFVTIHNYRLNPDVSITDDINYTFIGNINDFQKMFYMTKVSPGKAVVPDFSTQSVVAIILKPTEKVVSASINEAKIAGSELNIYYTITDTTSWKTYPQRPMVIAAVPKSDRIEQVSFYRNNVKEKTVKASY